MHFDLCSKHAGPGAGGCPFCAMDSMEAENKRLRTAMDRYSEIELLNPTAFMHMFQDAAVIKILAMSEADLRKKCEEDGEDFDTIAAETRNTINAAIRRAKA